MIFPMIIVSFCTTPYYGDSAVLSSELSLRRSDFLNIGGYDERPQTYSWDDEDLYDRLGASGLSKHNVSYDHVTHDAKSERSQTDLMAGKYKYDHLKPDILSLRETSTTWLIIGEGLIVLLLLVNISLLTYRNCCWQSKTTKLEIESIV